MSEFFTSEAIAYIRAEMLAIELEHDALIDAYDPYNDFEEDTQDDYDFEGNEDAGMEGYLFGWDS